MEEIQAQKELFLYEKGLNIINTLEDAISDLLRHDEVTSPDTKTFTSSRYNSINSNYQRLLRNNVNSDIPDSHRFAKHNIETIKNLNLF